MICCGGQRSCDLADAQGVIVQGGGNHVGFRLLRRGMALADVAPNAGGREAEEPAECHLHEAHVAIGIDEHPGVDNLLDQRVPRLPRHERALLGLPNVGDGHPNVGTDVDGKDLRHIQCQGDAQKLHEVRDALRDLGAQGVGNRLLQVLGGKARSRARWMQARRPKR